MNEDSCCHDHEGCGHDHGAAVATDTAKPAGATEGNGVANAAVLDALGEDKVTGEVVLVMFETRPWTLGDVQLVQLQEKLNSYMSFVLDGEMADQLPQFANRPVRLQLNCSEPPPPEVVSFLLKVREQISFQGINFAVEGLAPENEGGCGSGCGCQH